MRSLALVTLLVSSFALAAEDAPASTVAPASVSSGQRWSVVGARTAGANNNVLEGGLGWPGLSVGYLRGITSQFDLGVRGAFTYGQEGMVNFVMPGLKLNLLAKVRLLDTGKVALGFTFEPGPFFNTYNNGYTVVGFSIPVGVRLGIHPVSALGIGITFDLPFWVQFGAGGGFNVPILTGLGAEYFVDSSLLLFFKTRMGPTITHYSVAYFTFDAQVGLGWKF